MGILEEVKKCLVDGEECIILTADRNVANMEKVVLGNLKECGAEFRVNNMSFTRFCARTMGDSIKRCLTPEGSVMLLADVIEKCNKDFVYYSRVRPDSLAGEVYAALTALRSSGVSSVDLREKAEKMPKSLKNKATDLSLMYDGYLEALADRRDDSTTRLEACAKFLMENPSKYSGFNIFVVGMNDFNRPQLQVLEALDKGAKSLTIGLVSGFSNRNKRVYPEAMVAKVKALSKNKSAGEPYFENISKVQKTIGENLFSYENLPAREVVEVGDSLSIKKALTRQDEVLYVALDIVKKIMNGARYKDFEILVGNEEYFSIIRNVFDRYGIAYYIDQKELLQRQTKAKYILSALAVITKNYRNEEVLDFVKNPLFELTLVDDENMSREDKIFRFENYVLEYNVNYSKFLSPFDCGSEEKLQVAEEVRRALVNALSALGGNETRSMADIVKGVRDLIDNTKDAWDEHVEMLSKESEYFKKCSEQVDSKINAILDEIEGVLAGESTLEKFDTILRSMLKTLKIALMPTFLDSVFVGDMSSKFTGNGDLYVLGANSGALPTESEGGAIITAKDEELFKEAGISVYPTQRDRINKGLFTLIDILSSCTGQLTISYSLSSAGGALNPSSIILQMKGMFKKNGDPIEAEQIFFDNLRASMISIDELSAMFAGKDKGMHSLLTYAESGRATESDMEIYRTVYSALDDDKKEVLHKNRQVPEKIENAQIITKTSLSRLEQYFKCPYGYFLNYTLGLNRRNEGEVENFDAGTILHAVFEDFFTKLRDGVKDGSGKRMMTREDVEGVATVAFDKFINSDERLQRIYEKPDIHRLFDRLKKEGVRTCKDFFEISLHSKFRPEYLEVEFISKEEAEKKYGWTIKDRVLFEPIVLDLDDRQVEIRGKIDRVDSYENKFVIFDYKTYKSADLSESEIYHGEKLQLYIYAKAMKDNIGKDVVGVFYLPIFAGFNKGDERRYGYKGQISDNEKIRGEIFGELPEGVTSTFKQISVLPNPRANSTKASTFLNNDGFEARSNYAIELAKEGVKEIESGYIKPSYIKAGQGCESCEFKKICAYRDMNPREKYKVDSKIFDEFSPQSQKDSEAPKAEGGQE